ncbi:MAG TPA: aspartate--ammonia ligase [Candidatus Ozemobacteraceae bacterium]|nr:aspartate--ammonia ligase [Candidatus Ozemobacteraceae bacterium]
MFPANYRPTLDLFTTEHAIKHVKDVFEHRLAEKLNLIRVTAPRFLRTGNGLQDDLAGTQTPVSFVTRFRPEPIEVVHSLAKWKRQALGRYGFENASGLYTDMDAIRKDELVDEIHSIYVDQWDWERVMNADERNLDYLLNIVENIWSAIRITHTSLCKAFPTLQRQIPARITFIHSEDLEAAYPESEPGQREAAIAREHGAVFLIGIGHPLKSGKPHDLRAADYDDWSTPTSSSTRGLNGDIIVWDDVRQKPLELSSMGIRVDAAALSRQLELAGLGARRELEFHRGILENTIPLSIGGGIGQSRLCMYLLEKAHIGEVQASVWPVETEQAFRALNVPLL